MQNLPEDVQFTIRLEDIFMPQARRQRDDAYRKQNKSNDPTVRNPIRVVHYTTAQAALNIIKTKRIWMRNATCMADYSEVQHGFEILRRFFSDSAKTQIFNAALDKIAPGAGIDAIKLFDQWSPSIRFNTYIASISEHDDAEDRHGRLSMWRAFGGNTARVALVFKIPWYTGASRVLNVLFSPVAYLTEDEAHAVFYEVAKNIEENLGFLGSVDRQRIVNIVFYMLLTGVTCLKHEGFREEREWRAIYPPDLRPSSLMKAEASTEVIGGVPQTVYKIPLDKTADPALADLDFSRLFDRLIIGPSQYPAPMFGAFVGELTKVGVQDAHTRVVVSGIPIRS
jgi:hypothetical protein